MDIETWLRGLGLEQYAPAFRDNGIDARVLPDVTADDLKDLGITMVGHRRILLKAIASLCGPISLVAEAGVERPLAATRSDASSEGAASEAERRQVTVMFCDLVGSTQLASRLDPEDLREVFRGYHACVAQTVSRFDGFVAKYMGDGVLIYFGYPQAHEDDAAQAVRAGLALADAVGELQAPEPLRVRIGVATGLVVVGDLIGQGSAQEQAIVGETPNLAARLQTLAEPDAIVIAESTRRQIGAFFETVDLGPQSMKGFAEPQRAWRVISENRALGRFEALRSGTRPLIGREEELELLLRRWTQAKTGSGRVVLLSGEAGVGKSRFTEALEERIGAEPHVRLRNFCLPHYQDSALYPIIAQMERAAGFVHDDTPQTKLAKLQALLALSALSSEDMALIGEMHSLPAAALAPVLDVTPQKKKEKTFEALLRQIERLSRQQPVLMVFEDLHWIDPSSRELLDCTIARIEHWPVLLLATFRPEFQPPWLGQPHVMMLTLPRLDRRDTVALVESIAGNGMLPTEIAQEIAERTDGVPLFIEELTKTVIESGLREAATLSAFPHPGLSVPATLHASLMARLDRLGPAAKDVAQRGAAIGREFGYDLLASIADLPEAVIRDALDRLTNSGLLFVRGTPPQSSYTFKHALVQDAAYGMLLRGRRQVLHARIGAMLEEQEPEIADKQPELLAHHFTEANQAERAVDYWFKAGQQALSRSGMTEAEALLRKGLVLLSDLPDGAWRQEKELRLQMTIGRALMATKGYAAPAVGEVYVRARQLCNQLDRPDKLLPILYGKWAYHTNAADLETAQQLAEEMRQLGEMHGDVIAIVTGFRTSALINFLRGNLSDARADAEHAISLYDPAQRALYLQLSPQDPLVSLLSTLSLALVCLGHLDQRQLRVDDALAAARRLSHAYTLSFALVFEWLTSWLGRSDAAVLLHRADELLTLSDEHGFALWRPFALAARGWSLTASGEADQGVQVLTSGVTELGGAGNFFTPVVLTLLADAYRIVGQSIAGLASLVEADRFAVTTQVKWIQAETLRLRGDLLVAIGDHDAAEISFHEAIAVARRQEAKLFELRASTSLVRLWRDQGRRAEPCDLLAPVYNWFTEGFDAPDLVDAKALLDEPGC